MKIEDKTKRPTVGIADIQPGEVFEYCNEYFIKAKPKEGDDDSAIIGIHLTDGHRKEFHITCGVKRCDARIVIG